MELPEDARPWLRAYPPGVPSSYSYPDVSVTRLLDDAAQDFPDTVAINFRRHRLTYRKLADHVDRLATALPALGVRPADRIALLLPNCPQFVIGLFAVLRAGATVTLHDPGLAPGLLGAQLSSLGVTTVVCLDSWYGSRIAALKGSLPDVRRVIVTALHDYLPFPVNVLRPAGLRLRGTPKIPPAERVLRFAELVHRTLPAIAEPRLDRRRHPAVMYLAAGGEPLQVSQRALMVNAFQLRLWLPDVVAGDERLLLALPLWVRGAALLLVTAVLSAATVLLPDERLGRGFLRGAIRARPSILVATPEVYERLAAVPRRRQRLDSVRIGLSLGRALPSSLRQRLETLTDGGRIRSAWGSDPLGVMTHADPIYGRAEANTVGLPLPDTECAVVDPEQPAKPLPVGREGQLVVRGPQLLTDAWVRAAPVARLTEQGYLVLGGDG